VILLPAVEVVAVLVPERLHVISTRTGFHYTQSGRRVDRAVGIVQPFIDLAVGIGFLDGIDLEHPVPLRSGKRLDSETFSDLAKSVGSFKQHYAAHGIADLRSLFENLALPRIGLKRFALLDAQRLEHGHVEEVALLNRVVVDDRRKTFPELHSLGRERVRIFPRHGDKLVRPGIAALAQRINL
jgi:hypothetical protein